MLPLSFFAIECNNASPLPHSSTEMKPNSPHIGAAILHFMEAPPIQAQILHEKLAQIGGSQWKQLEVRSSANGSTWNWVCQLLIWGLQQGCPLPSSAFLVFLCFNVFFKSLKGEQGQKACVWKWIDSFTESNKTLPLTVVTVLLRLNKPAAKKCSSPSHSCISLLSSSSRQWARCVWKRRSVRVGGETITYTSEGLCVCGATSSSVLSRVRQQTVVPLARLAGNNTEKKNIGR